jgi:hypothetical protein
MMVSEGLISQLACEHGETFQVGFPMTVNR